MAQLTLAESSSNTIRAEWLGAERDLAALLRVQGDEPEARRAIHGHAMALRERYESVIRARRQPWSTNAWCRLHLLFAHLERHPMPHFNPWRAETERARSRCDRELASHALPRPAAPSAGPAPRLGRSCSVQQLATPAVTESERQRCAEVIRRETRRLLLAAGNHIYAGDVTLAQSALNAALRLSPGSRDLHRERAQAMADMGDVSGALREVVWWRGAFDEQASIRLANEIRDRLGRAKVRVDAPLE